MNIYSFVHSILLILALVKLFPIKIQKKIAAAKMLAMTK